MKLSGIKTLLALALLLPSLLQAKEYKEGVEYTRLATPIATQTGDKIEVLEFFWYGCPHCFQFEPKIHAWVKNKPANVEFVRMPAPLNPQWGVHTKMFYALEAMGKGDQYHSDIFNAIHVNKQKLFTQETIADFLAQKGVDKTKFEETVKSFAVEMRGRKAAQLGNQYHLSGVPTLTVNGKYVINMKEAGGFDGALAVLDYLVSKESAGK